MLSPRSHILQLHLPEPFDAVTLHVLDWGDENATRTTVCVHGLTRNAHDFDWVSDALAQQGRRVFSLDMPGRGDSPWLKDPMQYGYPLYTAACIAFMDNFHLRGVEWIGTSMGGLIGMMIAATQPKRIHKLIMNDIGARISATGIARIMGYVASLPSSFEDEKSAFAYLRNAFAPFGIRDEGVWQAFLNHSIRHQEDGSVILKTDPAIATPLLAAHDASGGSAVDLSLMWEQVNCPTLIIRGEESDLLSAETVSAMLGANLRAESVTMAGCGHAPSLTHPTQLQSIIRFLTRDSLIPGQAIGL